MFVCFVCLSVFEFYSYGDADLSKNVHQYVCPYKHVYKWSSKCTPEGLSLVCSFKCTKYVAIPDLYNQSDKWIDEGKMMHFYLRIFI